jgi:hypothetical protein
MRGASLWTDGTVHHFRLLLRREKLSLPYRAGEPIHRNSYFFPDNWPATEAVARATASWSPR